MDLTYRRPQLTSGSSTDQFNSPVGVFPASKTKWVKSARKHMEESHNSSYTNIAADRDNNSLENKPPTNMPHFLDQTEKSLDLTPLHDRTQVAALNFADTMKSPGGRKDQFSENWGYSESHQRRIEELEHIVNDLKAQNNNYKSAIEQSKVNEKKLKEHVQNLLDVNSKLSGKIRKESSSGSFLQKKGSADNANTALNGMEQLQKQLHDCTEEKDYLQDKIIELNQKLEHLMKKDVYKEKIIDFYKNRIKLYQFKLENYPKSDKEQIKYLEDYVMAILGENSKLNKALEKSELESKKWQEKYFDYEKSKEVLLTANYTGADKINNVGQKSYNQNNIYEKERGSSAKKEMDEASFWSCRPKK